MLKVTMQAFIKVFQYIKKTANTKSEFPKIWQITWNRFDYCCRFQTIPKAITKAWKNHDHLWLFILDNIFVKRHSMIVFQWVSSLKTLNSFKLLLLIQIIEKILKIWRSNIFSLEIYGIFCDVSVQF